MVTLAVVDTHALIWYAGQRWNKLGRDARRVFEETEAGNGALFVPTLTMVELGEAVRRGQVKLPGGLATLDAGCSRQGGSSRSISPGTSFSGLKSSRSSPSAVIASSRPRRWSWIIR